MESELVFPDLHIRTEDNEGEVRHHSPLEVLPSQSLTNLEYHSTYIKECPVRVIVKVQPWSSLISVRERVVREDFSFHGENVEE